MALCQICASLDLASIIRMKTLKRGIFKDAYPGSNDLLHWLPGHDGIQSPSASLTPYHATVADLIRNANTCNLCRVVHRSIASKVSLLENIIQSTPTKSSVLTHRVFLCGLQRYRGLQIMSYDENQCGSTPVYQLLGEVGFAKDIEDPYFWSDRRVPESPRSAETLEFIKTWLSHFPKRQETNRVNPMQPTRLLKYDQEIQKVVLCSVVPPDVEYAALSHCWGSVQPLTLNSQTAPQLRKGLPIGDFPQTFQDAFWLIEQLNISYLWIDSLCIFQDSKDDWVHESSRMCDVYGNAYIMIAAVRAKNCNEGFLGPRDQGYISIPFTLNRRSTGALAFPIPSNQGEISPQYVRDPIQAGDFADEPLSKRAWALQERYMSPRKLHFTRSKAYCEDGTSLLAEDGSSHVGQHDIDASFQRSGRGWVQTRWENIIKQYNRRSLTVDSDKLPAIAGLAASLSLRDPEKPRYVAGLWTNNLIRGMSWKIDRKYPQASAPRSYTAPSWSWASVNSAIQVLLFRVKELAIVRGIEVYLENAESPFGRVTGGWIHLSATKLQLRLAPGRLKGQPLWFQEGGFRCSVSVEWDSPRYDETGSCLADYQSQQLELFAVPLSLEEKELPSLSGISKTYLPPRFLIITPSKPRQCPIDNIPQFRRVGLGKVSMTSLADGNSCDADLGRLFQERVSMGKSGGLLEDIIIV